MPLVRLSREDLQRLALVVDQYEIHATDEEDFRVQARWVHRMSNRLRKRIQRLG